jgi:hypothetical protein
MNVQIGPAIEICGNMAHVKIPIRIILEYLEGILDKA